MDVPKLPRFYINLDLKIDSTIIVPDPVARHLLVLRLHNSSEIEIFNGRGGSYRCVIIEMTRKRTSIKILQYINDICRPPQCDIDLGLCIIANDKMDLALQKAVELGVRTITPLISMHSQKIVLDKQPKRLEHWQKIIISSCEQCGQNYLPRINLPIKFDQFITTTSSELKFILSPYGTPAILPPGRPAEALILVGPEGGFSSTEIESAVTHGFSVLNLGSLTLRAETAALAGICYLNFQCGNW